MSQFATSPQMGYLRLNQVLELIPVSKSTWWAGVKSGRFPQKIKISERITVWKAEDIHSWIKNSNNEDKANA